MVHLSFSQGNNWFSYRQSTAIERADLKLARFSNRSCCGRRSLVDNMARIANYLISARFITTTGHLTALLILFSTIRNNVEMSFADGATGVQRAYDSSIGALVFGIFCFIFDFSGIFFGNSLFSPTVLPPLRSPLPSPPILSHLTHTQRTTHTCTHTPQMNMFQIFFHFIGSLFLSWLITENWNYAALWPIVIRCGAARCLCCLSATSCVLCCFLFVFFVLVHVLLPLFVPIPIYIPIPDPSCPPLDFLHISISPLPQLQPPHSAGGDGDDSEYIRLQNHRVLTHH